MEQSVVGRKVVAVVDPGEMVEEGMLQEGCGVYGVHKEVEGDEGDE